MISCFTSLRLDEHEKKKYISINEICSNIMILIVKKR